MKNIKHFRLGALAVLFFVGSVLVASGREITFRNIFARPDGCVLVYGGLSFLGDDFLLKECDSELTVTILSTGYIKQLQFVGEDRAWGIVGTHRVRFDVSDDELVLKPVAFDEDRQTKLEDLYFVDRWTGFACGEDGVILRTVDGGDTWKRVESGTKHFLRRIRFTGRLFGWALGSSGFKGYLATRDGGETWKHFELPNNGTFTEASFVSESKGCGIYGKTVLCTSDGESWKTTTLPGGGLNDIAFRSEQTGWLAGGSVFKTSNGGRTWTKVRIENDSKKNDELWLDRILIQNEKRIWSWRHSSVYRTNDSGKTWEKISDKWLKVIEKKLQEAKR